MKKRVFIALTAACLLLTGCSSGVSQEDYDALVNENSELQEKVTLTNDINNSLSSKKSAIESENAELKEVNSKLLSENQKLQSDLDDLKNKVKDWLTYSQTQKEAAQAQAESDKINAEAEKIEAEVRLKTANEQLSQAEAEEQRRLTEGTTVYEDNYVKINFLKSGTHPAYSWYDCVTFLVENKTNAVLTFQAECISIDGMDIGNIIMSDPISPQSKGYIYAKVDDMSLNRSPSTISGQLRVIDFDKKVFAEGLKQSYDADFINIVVG